MKFDLKKPCKTCPFRKSTAFRFPHERVEDILFSDGGLACHKTTTEKGRNFRHKEAQACAGLLILLEKEEQPNQIMRIAERLGLYDRTKLDMQNPDVFDDIESFELVRGE